MAYAKILVAVDLSEESDEVLAAAKNLASEQEAQLSVATVVKPLARVYGGLDMAPVTQGAANFEREAVDQATTQLTQLAAEYQVAPADIHVLLGHPATEIRTMAEESGADLIVIGTHGRHGLGLLLGSTANAVLHGVGCDVLAVKIHPMADV